METTDPRNQLLEHASRLPRIQLSPRSLCDLELLASGGFSPVDRFLGKNDYTQGLEEFTPGERGLFPIPVTLSVEPFPGLTLDVEIALADQGNNLLAIMRVEEIYGLDLAKGSAAGLRYN